MSALPEPLTPADCDLRGLEYMPLLGQRLFGSEFNARATDSEWRAAITLWWAAWTQCPAASLPDDDIALCRLADLGRDVKAWRKLKEVALHGFIKCADGRLYHPTLAQQALVAWDKRVKERERKAQWRAKKAGQEQGQDADVPRDTTGTGQGQDADVPADVTRRDGTGRDSKEERVPFPDGNGAASKAGPPPDPDTVFWDTAKAYLADTRNPGALIGKWCRDHGKRRTAEALTRAQLERPVEKIPFIEGCLRQSRSQAEGRPEWGGLSVPC